MNHRTEPLETVPRLSGDLWVAFGCLAAGIAVTAGGVSLAMAHQVLAAGLVLWLVPGLLLVGARARRAHTKQKESKS